MMVSFSGKIRKAAGGGKEFIAVQPKRSAPDLTIVLYVKCTVQFNFSKITAVLQPPKPEAVFIKYLTGLFSTF
ncbi:hypothetical protein FQZ97_1043340 [compost metagenome]